MAKLLWLRAASLLHQSINQAIERSLRHARMPAVIIALSVWDVGIRSPTGSYDYVTYNHHI